MHDPKELFDHEDEKYLSHRFEPLRALARAHDAKPEEQKWAEAEERWAELDDLEEHMKETDAAFTTKLKSAGLPLGIIDTNSLEDTYDDHPLRDEFLSGGDLSDMTRAEIRSIHARWKMDKDKEQAISEQRRDAGLASMGSDRLLQEIKQEHLSERYEEAVAEAKADRLYIDGAAAILESWQAKGAKLQGVRFPLTATSKPVRWLKARTEGKARKHVAETVKRMAGKQRGWKADLEAYRAFS
ncbi:hypothetical protein NHF40_12510 [Maricaulaceae bacterium EIL42A08]|nr:hypothetical protein [Maricaulaceae bacterium EIL42A08]